MVMDKYILEGKIPVPAKNLLEWALWIEEGHEQRVVAQETIGKYWVSTVFLGLDHRFGDSGPPLLFETMVFDAKPNNDGYKAEAGPTFRAPTWEIALEHHAEACVWAREQMN